MKIRVPYDYNKIQDAINHSNDGDIIIIEPGIYYENIDLKGKNITLASKFIENYDNSFIAKTIIDGNKKGPVVTYRNEENENSFLYGLTIRNGLGRIDDETRKYIGGGYIGGGIDITSSPTIKNVHILNNVAPAGGGICCAYSKAKFEYVIIKENRSSAEYCKGGGGIYCVGSNITINNSKIIDNKAEKSSWYSGGDGGGIFCDDTTIIIENSSIEFNRAEESGGGIFFTDLSSFGFKEKYTELKGVKIIGNSAKNSGGGIGIGQVDSNTYPTIILNMKNVNILKNKSWSDGGGISCWKAFFRLEDSIIQGNKAERGGGIMIENQLRSRIKYNEFIQQILKNTKIIDNKARNGGGLNLVDTNIPIMQNVDIEQNHAEFGGGLTITLNLYNQTEQNDNEQIENVKIINNSAKNYGGVDLDSFANSTVTNKLFNIINKLFFVQKNKSEGGEEITPPKKEWEMDYW